jgi:hypothetical protein
MNIYARDWDAKEPMYCIRSIVRDGSKVTTTGGTHSVLVKGKWIDRHPDKYVRLQDAQDLLKSLRIAYDMITSKTTDDKSLEQIKEVLERLED